MFELLFLDAIMYVYCTGVIQELAVPHLLEELFLRNYVCIHAIRHEVTNDRPEELLQHF